MFGHNLTTSVLTRRVLNGIAAGVTSSAGTGVNTSGFTGVRFVGLFGALTASEVTTMKAQQSDDDGSSDDYTDIAGSQVGPLVQSTDGNKMLIIDIYRPQKKYVRPYVSRATGNAVVDGVIAELYHAEDQPVTAHSTVMAQRIASGSAEGTA